MWKSNSTRDRTTSGSSANLPCSQPASVLAGQQLPTSVLFSSGSALGSFQTPGSRKGFLYCLCKDRALSRSAGSANAISLLAKQILSSLRNFDQVLWPRQDYSKIV